MNMTGIVSQQTSKAVVGSFPLKKSEKATEGALDFHNLLTNGNSDMASMLGGTEIVQEEISPELLQFLMSLPQMSAGQVGASLEGDKAAGLNIREILVKLTTISSDNATGTSEIAVTALMNESNALNQVAEKLLMQFEAVLNKAAKLLSSLTDQVSAAKAAPEILKLLEQWGSLEKKSGGMSNMILKQADNHSKELAGWKELVQAFQKRNQFAFKNQYNTDAKVTVSDIAKWLNNAVKRQNQLEHPIPNQNPLLNSGSTMTKTEQFVIHMNMNSNTVSADQQLIEQFQKAIKTSRFMAATNGTSQLSLTLRPDNLGEMMVKLTKVNGEMTVKIMVSSQAAKDMLESNMHQLKNMFSPQQVAVEKQEMSTQQNGQTYQRSQEQEQQTGENQQGNPNQSQQHSSESEESDFQSRFEEILDESMEVNT